MDTYEMTDAIEPPRKKKSSALVWNILTILVLLAILCVVSVFFLIIINPNRSINPFPPPTYFPSVVPATITVTPRFTLVPSWTPTNVMAEGTQSPEATNEPIITDTPATNATVVEAPITTPPGGFTFVPREGSPSAIDAASFHPDVGCKWSGVAGQATSLNGEAVRGLFVHLGGSMPGVESIDKLAMTGLASQYGAGGFEFTLAETLIASNGTLWIQLLDQQNLPLSDRVYFDTYDDCQKNLVIIYFDQVK
jgi:hypothetical protein